MEEEQRMKDLKKIIDLKRERLNVLIEESSDQDQVLNLSIELDKLIVKYYELKSNIK